jgi:transcriptional regulator with XRE-family HTH domain
MRRERGWRQVDLADRVNVTQPYVGMIERGEISHPSREVREAFVLALGEDPFGAVGLALDARDETLGLVDAAAYLGVDHLTLRESEIPFRRDGHRYEYAIHDLDAARDKHPCSEPGCDRIALGESGGCEAHGHAILQRGTIRSSEIRERISSSHRATHADPERGVRWRAAIAAANRGRPRPDVRERVRAMHADREQRYRWGVRLAEGRDLPPGSKGRWYGRLHGLKAGKQGGKKPIEELYPEKAQEALALRANDVPFRAIAQATGLTKREVEGIVSRARLSP